MEIEEQEVSGIDVVRELAEGYRSALRFYSETYPATAEYSFGRFVGGGDITSLMREAIRLDLLDVKDPFRDEDAVTRVARDQELTIREGRMSELVDRASECNALLKRLYNHPLIGRVWRFTRRFINPSLRLSDR